MKCLSERCSLLLRKVYLQQRKGKTNPVSYARVAGFGEVVKREEKLVAKTWFELNDIVDSDGAPAR